MLTQTGSPFLEMEELKELAVKAAEEREALVFACVNSLRNDLFSNRANIHPRDIPILAGKAADGLLQYFLDPDKTGLTLGTEFCAVGLSPHSMAGLSVVFGTFAAEVFGNDVRVTALIGRFISTLMQGFFQTNEKRILDEQESFRMAFQIALDQSNREKDAARDLAQKTIETSYRNIILAQEEERRRISRELHDEAGQALIGIRMGLSNLLNDDDIDPTEKREKLQKAIEMTDNALTEIRALAYSLRPPVLDLLGLHLTIKQLCLDFSKQTGLTVNYSGIELPRLSDELAISLYRFVQEALTNVFKHAHAKKVWVNLESNSDKIFLEIKDDGKGFDPAETQPGIGLTGMRERTRLLNGKMQIKSAKGKPTQLKFQVPLLLKSADTGIADQVNEID